MMCGQADWAGCCSPGPLGTRHVISPVPDRRRDLDRTEKREFVSLLAAVFAETSMVVVTQNKGMTVAEVTDLRQRMRAAGANF